MVSQVSNSFQDKNHSSMSMRDLRILEEEQRRVLVEQENKRRDEIHRRWKEQQQQQNKGNKWQEQYRSNAKLSGVLCEVLSDPHLFISKERHEFQYYGRPSTQYCITRFKPSFFTRKLKPHLREVMVTITEHDKRHIMDWMERHPHKVKNQIFYHVVTASLGYTWRGRHGTGLLNTNKEDKL
jgi:hypothetical protein